MAVSWRRIPHLSALEDSTSGKIDEFDRLKTLAGHVADGRFAADLGVDFVWEFMLGEPMTAGNAALPVQSESELVELRRQLGDLWAANDFDLSTIARAIVLSDAFSLGDQSPTAALDRPDYGSSAYFSRHYKPLTGEATPTALLTSLEGEYKSDRRIEVFCGGLRTCRNRQAAYCRSRLHQVRLQRILQTSPPISVNCRLPHLNGRRPRTLATYWTKSSRPPMARTKRSAICS